MKHFYETVLSYAMNTHLIFSFLNLLKILVAIHYVDFTIMKNNGILEKGLEDLNPVSHIVRTQWQSVMQFYSNGKCDFFLKVYN